MLNLYPGYFRRSIWSCFLIFSFFSRGFDLDYPNPDPHPCFSVPRQYHCLQAKWQESLELPSIYVEFTCETELFAYLSLLFTFHLCIYVQLLTNFFENSLLKISLRPFTYSLTKKLLLCLHSFFTYLNFLST